MLTGNEKLTIENVEAELCNLEETWESDRQKFLAKLAQTRKDGLAAIFEPFKKRRRTLQLLLEQLRTEADQGT